MSWVGSSNNKRANDHPGLCHVGDKSMIDWPLFSATMIKRG
jgi:hypothetical protein